MTCARHWTGLKWNVWGLDGEAIEKLESYEKNLENYIEKKIVVKGTNDQNFKERLQDKLDQLQAYLIARRSRPELHRSSSESEFYTGTTVRRLKRKAEAQLPIPPKKMRLLCDPDEEDEAVVSLNSFFTPEKKE